MKEHERGLDHMTPAQLVRTVLEDCRRSGLPFGDAWELAIAALQVAKTRGRRTEREAEQERWRTALEWARPAFRSAYLRSPRGSGSAPSSSFCDAPRRETERDRWDPRGELACTRKRRSIL